MKIENVKTGKDFKPIKISITIETQEEFDSLRSDFAKTGGGFNHEAAFNKLYRFFQDLK